MRKQPAQIVTNKRSPVVHVSTEVPRPVGEAFEDIARANRENENGALTPRSSSKAAVRTAKWR